MGLKSPLFAIFLLGVEVFTVQSGIKSSYIFCRRLFDKCQNFRYPTVVYEVYLCKALQNPNKVSSIYADDVKLVTGKDSGDIILHDRRNPETPVKVWSTTGTMACTKRTIRKNWAKLGIESIDCSLRSIFGISRHHCFEINLV